MSPTILLSGMLMIVLGVGLYFISQETYHQRAQLRTLSQKIENEKNTIALLEAEWAYLNRPERIARLIESYKISKAMNQSEANVMAPMPQIHTIMPPMSKPSSTVLAMVRDGHIE